jgi:hypothetical protein
VVVAYVCHNPEQYEGKVVGSGQCVALVQKAAGAGHTSTWSPGTRIKGAGYITPGTVIATFIGGIYPNQAHGNHAAIYISHDEHGIRVWDQWRGHPVSQRTIRYKTGDNDPSNDADFYYVVA